MIQSSSEGFPQKKSHLTGLFFSSYYRNRYCSNDWQDGNRPYHIIVKYKSLYFHTEKYPLSIIHPHRKILKCRIDVVVLFIHIYIAQTRLFFSFFLFLYVAKQLVSPPLTLYHFQLHIFCTGKTTKKQIPKMT